MKILDDWRKVKQLDEDIEAIEKEIKRIDNDLQEDEVCLHIFLDNGCDGYMTRDKDITTAALKAARQILSVRLYNLRTEADSLIQK